MKTPIAIQTLITFLGTLVLYAFNTAQNSFSYMWGGILILFNLIVLSAAWWIILNKKFIALSVTIIVFKYAVFGIILYVVLKNAENAKISAGWFAVGVSTIIVTAIGSAVFIREEKKED